MPFNTSAKNLMLDALDIVQVSLHSGDPGASGTNNEISGGSYARQSISYATAANANRDSVAAVNFDVPAGATVAFIGYWATGNVYRAYKAVTPAETFANAGQFSLNDSDLNLNDPT